MAKKKIYPTLWWLYRDGLLPNNTYFIGYARSKITTAELRAKCDPFMQLKNGEEDAYECFWNLNQYLFGNYDGKKDFEILNKEISKKEKDDNANRLFYLALPPSVFDVVTSNLRSNCMATRYGYAYLVN